LDDIQKKRAAAAKAQKVSTAEAAALKEVKDRQKTTKGPTTKSPHGHMAANVPKHQKSATFNARGGSKR
jgi:hypothetical protein